MAKLVNVEWSEGVLQVTRAAVGPRSRIVFFVYVRGEMLRQKNQAGRKFQSLDAAIRAAQDFASAENK